MTKGTGKSTRRHYLFSAGLAVLSLFTAGGIVFCDSRGGEAMAESKIKCADCPMRARYDRNPKSIMGRIWKWHISWCPGWKAYLNSLPGGERARIMERYR
jgi:hypothetical protein